jgi:hypothetical protein
MGEETKEELTAKLQLIEAIRLEREVTDKLYAIKLVERIVFGMCGLILIAVLTAIIALVVTR